MHHQQATPPSGNVIEVIGADNDVTASMPAIGILNEAIADEAEGQCVMVGSVTGINTSSFTAGEELYVGSTAGVLTNTKPTSTSKIKYKNCSSNKNLMQVMDKLKCLVLVGQMMYLIWLIEQ